MQAEGCEIDREDCMSVVESGVVDGIGGAACNC